MSLEQQVIDLTQVTEQLLEAVNTRKADLDTAETNASLSAQIAASAEQNVLSAAQLANQYKIAAEAVKIQTGLDAAATAEDRQVVEAYVGDINNLVTIPFTQFAIDLIRTQTIVVEHHGFT